MVENTIPAAELERSRPHWFQAKAFQVTHGSWVRRPRGFREWARCTWNCDLFLWEIPVLKVTILLSWLGALLF